MTMKTKLFTFLLSLLIVSIFIQGFIINNHNNPAGAKTKNGGVSNYVTHEVFSTLNTIIYTDDMDGANDTTALKTRGYKVWYRGSGPQGLTATWYQGVDVAGTGPFDAFNGPTTGYVAANFNVVTGTNNIDSWLVLPRITGGLNAGDSLYFYSRSPDASTFPDSIRVMYSVNDSIPEGTWVNCGRFKVSTSGWLRLGFVAPTASVNGRFCIRYCVVNGGPTGQNSDYIGIDAINIVRNLIGVNNNNTQTPKEFGLKQNYPNPFNPTTYIDYDVPNKDFVNISVFNILGQKVADLVNDYKTAGSYRINFDASSLSSGVYVYKMTAGNYTSIKKMLLVK